MKGAKAKHGGCVGGVMTPTYKIWSYMKDRCLNPNNQRFVSYGGRGITVCDRWLSFENFLADMGERPEGMSIDRIDNNKGYSLENCRWATNKQQQRNKANNKYITHAGETKSLADWADHYGIKYQRLNQRMFSGWDFEDAINLELKINPKIDNRVRATNKTGCTGVSFSKSMGKYWARLTHNKKLISIGFYDLLEDAIAARKSVEQEIKNGQCRV